MIDGLNSMYAGLALYLPKGVRNRLLRPVAGERGQAFVEYVLLLSVIAISVFAVSTWTDLGSKITSAVSAVASKITAG